MSGGVAVRVVGISASAVTIGVLGGLELVQGGWLLGVVLATVGALCDGAWRLLGSARG